MKASVTLSVGTAEPPGGGGWWSGNYKIPGNQFSGDTFSVYWARFPAVLSSRYTTFMLPTPLPPPRFDLGMSKCSKLKGRVSQDFHKYNLPLGECWESASL